MTEKTNAGLARHALAFVGMPYWYGTCCYDCTETLLSRKAEQYPSHYIPSRMPRYRSDIARGLVCADCIGLAKGYMWLNEASGKQHYGANGCPDESANGMYEYVRARRMPNGPVAELPELPGLMLWRNGHVGVYIGGGEHVEARGFAYGVVRRAVRDADFTHWFALPGLAYEQPSGSIATALRRGDRGESVREMQRALLAHGCALPRYGADGDFGGETLIALLAFQRAAGLPESGACDAATWAALRAQPARRYVYTLETADRARLDALCAQYGGQVREA